MKAVKKRPGVPQDQLDKEAILLRAYGNGTEILIDRESWLSISHPTHGLRMLTTSRRDNFAHRACTA